MYRTMIATTLAAGLAVPALAQESCESQATAVWEQVRASDQLNDDQKQEVATTLNGALRQEASGDTEACLAAVEEVKVALNIQE